MSGILKNAMALFIQQNDNRSKLQEKLAAELRAKAKIRAELDTKLPDGVEDTNYLKDTKPTTSLAWVWIVIIVFAVVALTVLIVGSIK
jgi:hypothetical protein